MQANTHVTLPNNPTAYNVVHTWTATDGRTICQLAEIGSPYPAMQRYADTLTVVSTANDRLIARLSAIPGIEYLGTVDAHLLGN